MDTSTLIQEIERLPLTQKFLIMETTLQSIKRQEIARQMEVAAEALYDDYANDKELTAFSILDGEDFYELK
jgi:hypothetical protein